ncbi:MAG: PEP/pyruvate-binding domain-containing protein [Calditrichia bacterium]
MAKYLIPLSKINSVAEGGGKAYHLSLLQKWGYPVPSAVVISPRAFADFIRIHGIDSTFNSLLNNNYSAAVLNKKLQELKDTFAVRPVSRHLQTEIAGFLPLFKQKLLAVRSSALAEDQQESSFAGLFKTVLDVPPNPDSIIDAVKKVWLSAFDLRVWQYCREHKVKPTAVFPGVILQEIVDSIHGGIGFSLNPVNNDTTCVYIEEIPAKGESLAAGEAVPNTYLFSKTLTGTGTYEPWLETLTDQIIRLEKDYGVPVDVEWCLNQENQLFFLQARPVTTFSEGDMLIWTDENVGEVLPEVVTPLTWSILGPNTNKSFRWTLKSIGFQRESAYRLFRLINGRVYFNHTFFTKALNSIFPSSYRKKRREAPVLKRRLLAALHSGRLLIKFTGLLLFLPAASRRIEKRSAAFLQKTGVLDKAETFEESKIMIRRLLKLEEKIMRLHVANTFFGEILYQLMNGIFSQFNSNPADKEFLESFAEVGEARSALSGRELMQLADQFKLLGINGRDFQEFEEKIKQDSKATEHVEIFLNKYGHMSDQEFELSHPRWREEPAKLFKAVYSILNSSALNESAFKRDTRTGRKPSLRRLFFAVPRLFSRNRENLKQAFLQVHFALKKEILKEGVRLVEMGILRDVEEVYFLKLDELPVACKTDGMPPRQDLSQKAADRKAEHAAFKKAEKPLRYLEQNGEFQPVFHTVEQKSADNTVSAHPNMRKGIPCSSGKISGPARVLNYFEDGYELQPGEIMVTHSANPGWVPFFLLVKGIVTEIGGALSHSAIIAREYKIPMIAAVPDACRYIRTGDLLELDGDSGELKITQKTTAVQ